MPLLQKVADNRLLHLLNWLGTLKRYIIILSPNTELKSKLLKDITKQLEANYSKQVENLDTNLQNLQKANERDVNVLNQQLLAAKEVKQGYTNQIQDLQKQIERAGRISTAIFFNYSSIGNRMASGKTYRSLTLVISISFK
ncbi:hypothetical protein [Segetibacter aerophilus]|uniref:Uncharacterized protein n=1 Tax=Segetibacter aerophilus TaxID=670293 RepID=A0A512BJ27_9BACT|nr:hypothetical protein [Segetibacter aerophilus]GEO11982.1 hypothetical protein SAE01_44780 [Segetibacter aerophilus]